ncbi:MAG: radical SAM protein [Deltaproteobacteria bacterium]|nr:radical SAM protein [Deltaproteobacteria bacterium]
MKPEKPKTIHIVLTYHCNMRCIHCEFWKIKPEKEVGLSDWKKIIDDIYNWLGNNTVRIKIAGGEPAVKVFFYELMQYIKEKGFYLGITSNGTVFSERDIKFLCDIGINEINISLDTLDRKRYIKIRGKDEFDRVLQNLMCFKKYTKVTSINLSPTIMEVNSDEITELVRFAIKENFWITFQAVFNTFGTEYYAGWYKDFALFPRNIEVIEKAVREVIAYKDVYRQIGNSKEQLLTMIEYFRDPGKNHNMECNAGNTDIGIDNVGNLLLCFNLNPVGNLLERRIDELFYSKEADIIREEIKSCPRECKLLNCVFPFSD